MKYYKIRKAGAKLFAPAQKPAVFSEPLMDKRRAAVVKLYKQLVNIVI